MKPQYLVSFTIYAFYLQGFDPNSAFFTEVINKKKKTFSGTDSSGKKGRSKHGSDEESEDLDPVVLRSRQLASKAWSSSNFCLDQLERERFRKPLELPYTVEKVLDMQGQNTLNFEFLRPKILSFDF